MTEVEVAAAVAFWLSDAKRTAQKIRHRRGIADCRLPIADCRLPIADCRLPIADCRLPILRQRRLRSSYSGWFVSCLFLCVMPMTSATDKSHYTQKTPNIKFFCKKTCHSRPRLRRGNGGNQLAAGRRILRRRKPPVTGRGFYIPVILATAGIHPFAIFPFARSANGDLSPKMANPLRRQSRR